MEENKDKQLKTVDDYIKLAEDKLTEFIKSGRYKDVLLNMANLYRYSVNNQILILMQRPDAKTVNGMTAWNYVGRTVIPGEKSIKIISPVFKNVEKEVTDENGEVKVEEEAVLSGYTIGHLFDISQTQGREIEQITCNQEMAIENFNLIKKALEQCVGGYSISYTTHIEEGCDGYCIPSEKKIVIRDGMPTERTLTTMIHEIAHSIAEEKERVEFKGLSRKDVTQIREIEAESVAFVISTKLGLTTQDFNLAYMSTWAEGDIEKFKANLDVIRSISYKMAVRLDQAFFDLQQTKNKENEQNNEKISKKSQINSKKSTKTQENDEILTKESEEEVVKKTEEKKTSKKKKEVEQC